MVRQGNRNRRAAKDQGDPMFIQLLQDQHDSAQVADAKHMLAVHHKIHISFPVSRR